MLVKMVKTGGTASTSAGRFLDPKITAGMAPNSYTKSFSCPGARDNWYRNTMAFTTMSATVTTGFIVVGLSSRSGIIRRDRTFVLQRGQFRDRFSHRGTEKRFSLCLCASVAKDWV